MDSPEHLIEAASVIKTAEDAKLVRSLLQDLESGDTQHDLLLNRLVSILLRTSAGLVDDLQPRLDEAATAPAMTMLDAHVAISKLGGELRTLGMDPYAHLLRELLLLTYATRLAQEMTG